MKAKILGVVGHGGVHCPCCGGKSRSRSALSRCADKQIRAVRRRERSRAIREGLRELRESRESP